MPERGRWLAGLDPAARRAALARLDPRQRAALATHWRLWAHPGQLPPPGEWLGWLILAGRGFGKTRAGAEWVRARAEADPAARIALVGASLGEVRQVMIEGESGLMAIAPPRRRPRFEPSKRLLVWPGGAEARLFSAAEPESLRGPQHSHACRLESEGRLRHEALARIDALLHGAIEDQLATPPIAPAEGQCWLVASGASGAWPATAERLPHSNQGIGCFLRQGTACACSTGPQARKFDSGVAGKYLRGQCSPAAARQSIAKRAPRSPQSCSA